MQCIMWLQKVASGFLHTCKKCCS